MTSIKKVLLIGLVAMTSINAGAQNDWPRDKSDYNDEGRFQRSDEAKNILVITAYDDENYVGRYRYEDGSRYHIKIREDSKAALGDNAKIVILTSKEIFENTLRQSELEFEKERLPEPPPDNVQSLEDACRTLAAFNITSFACPTGSTPPPRPDPPPPPRDDRGNNDAGGGGITPGTPLDEEPSIYTPPPPRCTPSYTATVSYRFRGSNHDIGRFNERERLITLNATFTGVGSSRAAASANADAASRADPNINWVRRGARYEMLPC